MKVHRCITATCLLFGTGLVCGAELRVQGNFLAAFYSLRAATVQEFKRYVANVESENACTLREGPFLWIDTLDSTERIEAIAKLRAGDVQMRRLSTKAKGRDPDVTGGMIHDWEGIVFIPGVKLDNVLHVLQDYNHHASYFAPDVEQSRVENHEGDHYRVFLRFRREKIVTVILDTEHEVDYFRDSPTRTHSRSSAVRIAQVENPGAADEKEKTPGEDDGYLWKMETWWRLEEKDGGVYVQNEAVTLTRDIPTGLGWLIEPFITRIPKETLEFTLSATRRVVLHN